MSHSVADLEVDDPNGPFRCGCTPGITWGIRLGIPLERHPLRAAKTLAAGGVGGSAGVPDSLGHKPVNTSGRAGGPLSFPCGLPSHLAPNAILRPSYNFPKPILLISCRLSVYIRFCGFHPWFVSVTCGNAVECWSETVGRAAVRISQWLGRSVGKSLENGVPNLLHGTRRRVIIELSPGELETTPNTTPGASHVGNGETRAPKGMPAMTTPNPPAAPPAAPAPTPAPTPPAATPPVAASVPKRLGNGELRAMVAKVLADRAGTDLTPRAIAHALNRSSGAVGNACKVLADRGQAEVASTAPLAYRATTTTASAAASTIIPAPPRHASPARRPGSRPPVHPSSRRPYPPRPPRRRVRVVPPPGRRVW